MHGGPPPRGRQVDVGALIADLGATAHLLAYVGNQLLSERHHVGVVGISLVDLHRGELGVVAGADPLVAKDAPQLVDPLKAAHYQPLEVQLGGDAQGEG